MTDSTAIVTTLSYWNILILPTGEEIFVGLRQRPESMTAVNADEEEPIMPFTLHNSDPIKTFDTTNGFGQSESGISYVLIGQPSDPHGMIRFSVSQMMRAEDIHWKYEFSS